MAMRRKRERKYCNEAMGRKKGQREQGMKREMNNEVMERREVTHRRFCEWNRETNSIILISVGRGERRAIMEAFEDTPDLVQYDEFEGTTDGEG